MCILKDTSFQRIFFKKYANARIIIETLFVRLEYSLGLQ